MRVERFKFWLKIVFFGILVLKLSLTSNFSEDKLSFAFNFAALWFLGLSIITKSSAMFKLSCILGSVYYIIQVLYLQNNILLGLVVIGLIIALGYLFYEEV